MLALELEWHTERLFTAYRPPVTNIVHMYKMPISIIAKIGKACVQLFVETTEQLSICKNSK